ncbi:MAG: response regulator [Sandaracinaceae bacterium]|nr:response regulator [Sandaracinaceae bacterium]
MLLCAAVGEGAREGLEERLARLEAENAELRKSDLRLAHVLEIARIGSWELDLVTRQAIWAPETRHLLGVGPDAPATPDTVLAVTDPADRHIIADALAGVLAGSKKYDITYRVHRPDGMHIIHSRGDVLTDEAGHPRRIVGVVQDVTAQEELRAQLLQSQKMETLGRLSAALAHDLNNMLTVILGSCDFVAESVLGNAAAEEDVSTIREAAHRAAELTRGLLAYSRRQHLRPEPVDVNEVLGRLRKMLDRLLGESIRLEVLTAPVAAVLVDPQQLLQALVNLAVNARDAMPDGGTLTLRTSQSRLPLELGGGDRAFVLISVHDTGIGMDRETLAQVFEPFFTTKPPHQGTGLGLATAYGVVAQSGGFMRAQSTLGEGSTFEIYLPIGRAVPVPQAVFPEGGVTVAKATILVVEDDPAVRRMAVRALERAGYRVLQAASGDQALVQHAGAEGIDVVLTDVMMPGASGRELADALRARNPRLRALFMSGYTGDPRLEGRGPRSEDAFLPKPFTPAELVRFVAKSIGETPS